MFLGRSDDEPSPVKSAWRKARLKAAVALQTYSGTTFSALSSPTSSARGLASRLSMVWTSSSKSLLPEAMTRS